MAPVTEAFDPRAIIGALERNYVEYVVIGGLARVLRGSFETTRGVDVCPSLGQGNLERLGRAASELDARPSNRAALVVDEQTFGGRDVITFTSSAGELKIVASPAGATNGFVDLRRAATKEDLGHGLRPLIASTGDLARMAAALNREEDVARLPELRRIMELEVDREAILTPPVRGPGWVGRRTVERERETER